MQLLAYMNHVKIQRLSIIIQGPFLNHYSVVANSMTSSISELINRGWTYILVTEDGSMSWLRGPDLAIVVLGQCIWLIMIYPDI